MTEKKPAVTTIKAESEVEAAVESTPESFGPLCRHIRSKGMYVYTDVPEHEGHADYDNTIFWCQKTLKDIGPDQGFVGREDCCATSRRCYEID
ncbi:hypothetical protein [Paludisphaera rhizosphaerae]|uniref:hypothetical protein n=1 Tax=Paludisphaera rhizosphaerae TaxID=2711216 RepID=UPI0013ED17E7|nr:hypothetical protein [Paludisphaera rhizosphaerae]